MDAILTQLQQLTKMSSGENPDAKAEGSGSRNRNKEEKNHKDKEDEPGFHVNEESIKIKDKALRTFKQSWKH